MALADAYATAAEYRARATKTDTADDATILSQLTAVSRYLDHRCRRPDGFSQSAAVEERVYNGNGQSELWLPDDIATSTGLIVKVDTDADYSFADETALVLDTDFWLGPWNADKRAEPWPWEFLAVHPTSSVLSAWPDQKKALQVTAKFGWPAVPGGIKDVCIALTRHMRDTQEAGMTFTQQVIDSAVQESREMVYYIRNIERQYARPSGTRDF